LPSDTIAALFLVQQAHRPTYIDFKYMSVEHERLDAERFYAEEEQWDDLCHVLPGPGVVSLCWND